MTGATALKLWECAVEPVRREGARARIGERGALARYEAAVEVLKSIRIELCDQVLRHEDGALSRIASEFAGFVREIRTLGGAA
jgi:hypothetical protein